MSAAAAKEVVVTEASEAENATSGAAAKSDVSLPLKRQLPTASKELVEGAKKKPRVSVDLTATEEADGKPQAANDENCSAMANSNGQTPAVVAGGVDADLYSRQIGALGLETMNKLIKMKVLISGLRGVGVETAKNLILAGPAKVSLHDDSLVEMRDLASNFYATETDVKEGKTRADACCKQLSSLNDYVEVDVVKGPLENLLTDYSVVVFSNTPKSKLVKYNEICRSKDPQPVGFIVADVFGVASSIFVDFGPTFRIHDADGEQPRHTIVAGITHGKPGVVQIHDEKPMPFSDGDYVSFREVTGMTELNDSPPRKIKITGKHLFEIEDTTGYTPHIRGGIVYQVKVPVQVNYGSFAERCKRPLPDDVDCLPMPDLGKFGRPEQLHFAIQALMDYQDSLGGKLPPPHDEKAIAETMRLAKEAAEIAKKDQGKGVVTVDQIDEDVVKNVVKYAATNMSPMAGFVGGIVAQEVVKFTGKYTSIRQWLYVDAFEAVPPNVDPSDCKLSGVPTRYDDLIAVWGKKFQDRLADLNLFLIGAGALGCEFLKQFALLGCCTSAKGLLTVTDNDSIETSNLNRQFLFRRQHIGKSKSLVATESAKAMNSNLKVVSLSDRLGAETEEKFNDPFWTSLDIVYNALDNVPSRLYIDGMCVWHGLPLLESGTLGTKGNVQVVLPRITESYGDSRDPPEESIPLCTLKHFPYEIEHTIEWARDAFEGIFVDGPQQAVLYVKDPVVYVTRLRGEGPVPLQRERLQKIYDILTVQAEKSKDANDADNLHRQYIRRALLLFHDYFYIQISQLLHNFPADHVTANGQPFWSGPKRAPAAVKFDITDPTHVHFVHSASNLFAASVGAPMRKETSLIADVVAETELPPFAPRQVRIKVDDSDTSTVEGALDDDDALKELQQKLNALCPEGGSAALASTLVPTEFEKDDDSNYHVDFVWACANLRARNYSIPECDRLKAKMISGKIIPALATTTAMITGLVGLEGLKVVDRSSRKIEDYKNAFINLSTPLWLFSEPMPPPKTVAKEYDPIATGPIRTWPEEGFSSWDKIEVKIPNGTIAGMLTDIEKRANVEIAIVSVGVVCLYNSYLPAHKPRLTQPIKELYEQISKSKLPAGRNYVACELSCTSKKDDVDIVMPPVKFVFE